jgi:hypothetical protein
MLALLWIAVILSMLASTIFTVEGFQLHRYSSNSIFQRRSPSSLHFSQSIFDDDDLLAAASQKLQWEIVQERQQQPVLNLSARDRSQEETNKPIEPDKEISSWQSGERWTTTKDYLQALGIDMSSEADILLQCPQLLRLESSMVQDTASWIIEAFDVSFLESEWQLLSYPRDDVAYGLEFVGTMMMMTPDNTRRVCRQSSALLLQGIQGGIQERAVQEALGSASEATSKASQYIAADTMQSFRQLRANNQKKI